MWLRKTVHVFRKDNTRVSAEKASTALFRNVPDTSLRDSPRASDSDTAGKKYAAMLREAFEPFVQRAPKAFEMQRLNEPLSEEELKRFPLSAPLVLLRS
jgi:hypothetical protein